MPRIRAFQRRLSSRRGIVGGRTLDSEANLVLLGGMNDCVEVQKSR